MNIDTILDNLYEIECDTVHLVLTTKHNTNTTGFSHAGSWRGYYNQPALFMGDNTSKHDLIDELECLRSGQSYEAYKGGDYSYDGSYPLTIETDSSTYTGDEYISSVRYCQKTQSIKVICTKN